MVSHVVLLTPRADLAVADRQALIDAFERAILEIPTIRAVRIGQRLLHGAGYEASGLDAEYLVVIDFDDLSGLEMYLRHPAHEHLGARFAQSLRAAAVYDFDVGGVERLRSGGLL